MSSTQRKADFESIDEFNDFRFSLTSMVEQAHAVLTDLKERNLMIKGDFHSDEWSFICDTRHTKVYINFKEAREKLIFGLADPDLLITSLKCWITTLIPTRSLESIKKYYRYVEEFLKISRVFDEKLLEKTRFHLIYECEDVSKWNFCVPTINFLDFYEEIDSKQVYKKMLVDIKKDIDISNVAGKVRKLPPADDILAFSWAIENYYSTIDKSDDSFLRYYPLYLWWNMSNLIPMRPSEFCEIERDALSQENGRYYLRLPRLKQRNNTHKIQIVDKIAIPKDLYEQLQEYIVLTDRFGFTETLISYPSIRINKIIEENAFTKRFRYDNLLYLLNEFYNKVVDDIYYLEYSNRIRPGDTRHFAFLNLMRQGYHPVEIARLGGHTSIQAQYHYQQHMEYWVDVEIIQMMQRFNLTTADTHYNNSIDDDFVLEKILKHHDSAFKMELEIGYCTDPDMFCQVDKCYYCDHWRITKEEYLEKRRTIENELSEVKSEIKKLIITLNNLYTIAFKESFEFDYDEHNQDFNKDLFLTKSQLDEKVYRLNNFSSHLSGRKR